MTRSLVALGSNQGPRRRLLDRALAELGRLPGTRVVAASAVHETAPERPEDGAPFLNAAALLETRLRPRALLAELQAIERRCGRRRPRRPTGRGPRVVDLDVVLMDGVRRRAGSLRVPHPRFRERPFVLEPAAEVAPGMRDPETGRTVAALRGARPWSG